jgi:hypothetical protein
MRVVMTREAVAVMTTGRLIVWSACTALLLPGSSALSMHGQVNQERLDLRFGGAEVLARLHAV